MSSLMTSSCEQSKEQKVKQSDHDTPKQQVLHAQKCSLPQRVSQHQSSMEPSVDQPVKISDYEKFVAKKNSKQLVTIEPLIREAATQSSCGLRIRENSVSIAEDLQQRSMTKASMMELNKNQASSKDDETSIEDNYQVDKPFISHYASFQPFQSQNKLNNQHLKSVEDFDKHFMTSFPEFQDGNSLGRTMQP